MNVIVGVALAALIIGSVLIQFWPAIEALSGGAAAFLGALVGAAAGLGAILTGALYNAKLNRDENKRLRQEEAHALAVALAAELDSVSTDAREAATALRSARAPLGIHPLRVFDPSHWPIFEGCISKIGLLGNEIPGGEDAILKVMRARAWRQAISVAYRASILDPIVKEFDAEDVERFAKIWDSLAESTTAAAIALRRSD